MGCLNHQQYFPQLGGFHPAPFLTIFSHIFQPFNLGDASDKSRCKMGTLCKKANARATALLHCTICKRFGCQLSHSCCTWRQSQQQKNEDPISGSSPNQIPQHFQAFWRGVESAAKLRGVTMSSTRVPFFNFFSPAQIKQLVGGFNPFQKY